MLLFTLVFYSFVFLLAHLPGNVLNCTADSLCLREKIIPEIYGAYKNRNIDGVNGKNWRPVGAIYHSHLAPRRVRKSLLFSHRLILSCLAWRVEVSRQPLDLQKVTWQRVVYVIVSKQIHERHVHVLNVNVWWGNSCPRMNVSEELVKDDRSSFQIRVLWSWKKDIGP